MPPQHRFHSIVSVPTSARTFRPMDRSPAPIPKQFLTGSPDSGDIINSLFVNSLPSSVRSGLVSNRTLCPEEDRMSPLRPRQHLDTHEVTNQPPPFENVNLFESDLAFVDAISHADGRVHLERLARFGARAGSAEVAELAMQANQFAPRLKSFDRYGRRIDEVEFHPAYHALMKLGLESGVASAAWSG